MIEVDEDMLNVLRGYVSGAWRQKKKFSKNSNLAVLKVGTKKRKRCYQDRNLDLTTKIGMSQRLSAE